MQLIQGNTKRGGSVGVGSRAHKAQLTLSASLLRDATVLWPTLIASGQAQVRCSSARQLCQAGRRAEKATCSFSSPGTESRSSQRAPAHYRTHSLHAICSEGVDGFELKSIHFKIIIIIIVTGLESHTRCASRAHEVRLYVP